MRRFARPVALSLAMLAAPACAAPDPEPVLISGGAYQLDRQPDGNTIVFENAEGLTVVDTGRHPAHQAKILDHARARGKPIVAIVNTHWHLDHSGGNAELRAVFPNAKLYTATAVQGALDGFLARSLASAKARYADPKLSDADKALVRLGIDAIENRRDLLPDMPVAGDVRLGTLELHLAPFAATQGDVWLFDPASGTLVAGDLVVIPAPFFDTGCAKGWKDALEKIARVPFTRLIPGHGPELDRAGFLAYRAAFDAFVDCAAGTAPKAECVAGWQRDAARFLPSEQDRETARALLDYYVDRVLHVPAKQRELCSGPPS